MEVVARRVRHNGHISCINFHLILMASEPSRNSSSRGEELRLFDPLVMGTLMRRATLAAAVLGVAGLAVPAMAAPPRVPVGVGHNSNGDVCVYAFTWVP